MSTTSRPTWSANGTGGWGLWRIVGVTVALITFSACGSGAGELSNPVADEVTSDHELAATSEEATASPLAETGPAGGESEPSSITPAAGTTPTDASASFTETTPPPDEIDASTPLSTGVPDAIFITVPPATYTVADPVPFTEPAEFGDGVEVRLVTRGAIDVITARPGEIGGPAVLLTLEFINRSSVPIDLGIVTVDLVLADQVSANQVTTDPAAPVSGVLPAGESRTGVYVFTAPLEARADVDLTIRYSAITPMVVFSGSLIDE
jgi:hypothetical protein